MALFLSFVNSCVCTPVCPLSWRPESLSFLYGRLGLQCQQCGLRFFQSAAGKAKMDAHLDWHFTRKRRIREGAARTQGRLWLAEEKVRPLSAHPAISLDQYD